MSIGRNENPVPPNYEIYGIPVEQVQLGSTVVADFRDGPVLYRVERIGFSSEQQKDGSYANAFTLTLEPVAGIGSSRAVTVPLGTIVGCVLRRTA